MNEREKPCSFREQRFGDGPASARDADREEQEVVGLRFVCERGGENGQPAGEAFACGIVSGEKPGDLARMFGPCICGPQEHFAAKTAGADDQYAVRCDGPSVCTQYTRSMVGAHSVPLGGNWFSGRNHFIGVYRTDCW